MDGSGPKFFSLIDSVLSIVLAASLLASAGPRALAETGAIMIAIGQMKLGSAPTGFTFARIGKGAEAEAGGVALWTKADGVTRFDKMTITTLP